MIDNFTSYDQSKVLKDLGFSEPCLMQWRNVTGHMRMEVSQINFFGYVNSQRRLYVGVALRTQAADFLHRQFNIICNVLPIEGGAFSSVIYDGDTQVHESEHEDYLTANNEALNKALELALIKTENE